jgi:phosphate transport system substrate-binding protein
VKKKKRTGIAVSALVLFIITVTVMSLLSSCGSNSEFSIIVAGSTSVQPYAEILAEAYMHDNPESEIDVQGGGSSAGITAALSHTADIGMSSRALKDTELEKLNGTGQELWSVEIAKDGLAIIIHPDNPIKNLTLEQICAIYAAEVTNWKELGGKDAKIHVITREEGSGTRDAFEELVMNKKTITPKAIVQDSNGAVRLLVSDDKNSIGFISLGLVEPEKGQKEVKALLLEGVEATVENVRNGSYKLFRPFLFVTVVAEGEEPTGLTKQFIDFTLSDEGQQILIKEGLIPHMNTEDFETE